MCILPLSRNVNKVVVGGHHRGFVAKLYEHSLAQLVGAAVASAVKTIAVPVVSVPVRSVGRWSAIFVNVI